MPRDMASSAFVTSTCAWKIDSTAWSTLECPLQSSYHGHSSTKPSQHLCYSSLFSLYPYEIYPVLRSPLLWTEAGISGEKCLRSGVLRGHFRTSKPISAEGRKIVRHDFCLSTYSTWENPKDFIPGRLLTHTISSPACCPSTPSSLPHQWQTKSSPSRSSVPTSRATSSTSSFTAKVSSTTKRTSQSRSLLFAPNDLLPQISRYSL